MTDHNMAKGSDSIISALGFSLPVDVRGRLSIADLFAKSKTRTGIYLLEFANNTFYIGQAKEVCRRFAQHCASVGDISRFTFLPVKLNILDETERKLIRSAESAGLPLTNRVHVSSIVGETDFDLLVPPSTQRAWIEAWPRPQDSVSNAVKLPLNSAARIRTDQAFGRLRKHSDYAEVLSCLHQYCSGCIPFPSTTQLTFWSVSCLPSTNKSTWPRFAAVNAGVMEMLVIGWEAGTVDTWGFVNGSRSIIERDYGTVAKFAKNHRRIHVDDSRQYRSAGADQIRFAAASVKDLTFLLEQPTVRDSAAQLALNVMRTRPTIYSKFHCPSLAEAMISRVAS